MRKSILSLMVVGTCLMLVASGMAATVSMKLSGAGKVNDSTIKAGEKVSLDIYFDNEKPRMGLSLGFKLSSPDKSITTIVHPADSGKGLAPSAGDIKGYGIYANKSVFKVLNQPVLADWDGKLPDVMGFMTMVLKDPWATQPVAKNYSIDLIVPTAGTLVVDSAFFPPGGKWIFVTEANQPPDIPVWKGPYKFKVVK
ncbi:hypothetical protein C3F09_03925 [candidate division GN15 bacterium]|uniref:Uncharacterized protein n=1 Tax=candidate division GN15 bacterium TaxID=2072418 RepID=A0A855X2R4_9BACT|nr:MAG: hypothetical protein C3F09_03925 [candidate division GN15 bacterium]